MTALSSESVAVVASKSELQPTATANGGGVASNAGTNSATSAAGAAEDYAQLPIMTDAEFKKMKQKVQNTRIALSKQGARFELPIDMKSLETHSAAEYLVERCHVTKRREHLYKKHFQNYDKDKDQKLNLKELEKAMKDVFVDTIDSETVEIVTILAGVNKNSTSSAAGELVPFNLFSAMCALSERLMHQKYSTGEASLDPLYSQKDKLEDADFSSLAWKLHGLNIKPELATLMYVILDPDVYLPKNILEQNRASNANNNNSNSYVNNEVDGGVPGQNAPNVPTITEEDADSATAGKAPSTAEETAGTPPKSQETTK